MALGDDFPVAGPAPVGPISHHHGGETPARRFFIEQPTPPREEVSDVAAVLGMPEGSIPPALQPSILMLLEELNRLRSEVEQLRRREEALEQQVNRHPLLPILNRSAFLQAVSRLLLQSARINETGLMPGAVVILHVGGLETLREVHGFVAGQSILDHVAEFLISALRQIDPVGYLDGGDFAVGLAMAEDMGAEEKTRQLADGLMAQPVLWNSKEFLLTVTVGVAHFRPGDNAVMVLERADASRRGVA